MLLTFDEFEKDFVKDHADVIREVLSKAGFTVTQLTEVTVPQAEFEEDDEIYIREGGDDVVVLDAEGSVWMFFDGNLAYQRFDEDDKISDFLGYFCNLYML